MKTRKIYRITMFMACAGMIFTTACSESDPSAQWSYKNSPEIADGESKVEKLCYNLKEKFDIHGYWNLSGDDAIRKDLGNITTNTFKQNNSASYPIQAADEAVAEKFFALLMSFYELLPEGMPSQDFHKRHNLVRIKPMKDFLDVVNNEYIFANTYSEEGAVYYGYMQTADDARGDRFDTDLRGWKLAICSEFFTGLINKNKNGDVMPQAFKDISKGYYRWEVAWGDPVAIDDYYFEFYPDIALQHGFIHPLCVMPGYHTDCWQDWGVSAGCFMLLEPDEREYYFDNSPKIEQKYDIIKAFFSEEYGIDIDQFGEKWRAVTID